MKNELLKKVANNKAVLALLETEKENLKQIPAVDAYVTTARVQLEEIQNQVAQSSYVNSAIIDQFRERRDSVCDKTLIIAHKLTLLAKATNNTALLADVALVTWEFKRKKFVPFLGDVIRINERAIKYQPAAAAYMLTKEEVDALGQAIKSLSEVEAIIRLRRQKNKADKEKMDVLFDKMSDTFEQLFNVLKLLKFDKSTEGLYSRIWGERCMKLYPSRSIALRGTIANASEVLPGATFVIKSRGETENATAATVLERKSDTGRFMVKSLAAGNYLIEVKKAGYKPLVSEFVVDAHKTAVVSLTLEPAV